MTPRSPLAGKRIVITRPREQAAALVEALAALDAEPILLPMIETVPVDDFQPLDAALAQLDQYQWIVFTSSNAVAIFFQRLGQRRPASWLSAEGDSAGAGATTQYAAVGPATARALDRQGVMTKVIPDEYQAEALALALGAVAGQRVLLPHAEMAREALAAVLRQRGAMVEEIAVYQTLPAAPDPHGLDELRRGVDAITLTSGSAARNFAPVWASLPSGLHRPAVVCLGPVTAAGAREAGLPVDAIAAEYTLPGLVAALASYFAAH